MTQEFQTRPLGASGLIVSPLGVGTNRWSFGKNDEKVIQAFNASLEAGINFFDTAEIYGFGKSEKLVGACLKQTSHKAVIASKFASLPTRRLSKALDATLARLGLPALDLYYIHFPIGNIDALMDQMAAAYQAGKIRAVGVSNYSAAQMHQAADRLARYPIPLAANEVHYNLWHRQPEVNGVLDACKELNVALVAYVPLASGRLTKSAPQAATSSTSADKSHALQQTLQTIAEAHGKSTNQVILNWLLQRDDHIIPIPGTTRAAHALNNAETLTWQLTAEEFAAIDAASSSWK